MSTSVIGKAAAGKRPDRLCSRLERTAWNSSSVFQARQ
jgi:hypothetical protein